MRVRINQAGQDRRRAEVNDLCARWNRHMTGRADGNDLVILH